MHLKSEIYHLTFVLQEPRAEVEESPNETKTLQESKLQKKTFMKKSFSNISKLYVAAHKKNNTLRPHWVFPRNGDHLKTQFYPQYQQDSV